MNTATAVATIQTVKAPTFRSYYKAFKEGHLEKALMLATGPNKRALLDDLRAACARKWAAVEAERSAVTEEVYSRGLLASGRTSNYCAPENGGRDNANAQKRPWAQRIHSFPETTDAGYPDQTKLAGRMTWLGEQHGRYLDIQNLIERFSK